MNEKKTSCVDGIGYWVGARYHEHSDQPKFVAERLLKQFDFRDSDHVLDVGCGDGKLTALLAKKVPLGSVTGLDPSNSMLQFATKQYEQSNLKFEQKKASEVTQENTYDVITSFSALHWEPKQKEALSAFKKALKAGGAILLAIPGPDFTLRHALKKVCGMLQWAPLFAGFESPGRVWNPNEYAQLLLEADFEIRKIEWVYTPFIFQNHQRYADFLKAMLPHVVCLSEDLRGKFVEEVVQAVKDCGHLDLDGNIRFDVRVIEIIAYKPKA